MGFYDQWDARSGGEARSTSPLTDSSTTPYGARGLADELARLHLARSGTRNDTLNEVAFAIFQLVYAGHVDLRDAEQAIGTAGHGIGLSAQEIAKTLGSAREGAARKPRTNVPDPSETGTRPLLPDVRWDPGMPVVPKLVVGVSGPPEPLATPVVDADLAEGPSPYDALYIPRSGLASLPRGEPLIEDWIDRHTYFVLVGRDQTYKSFLAIDWLLCLATGRPWMGKDTVLSRVLYVIGEGAFGLDDRVTAWERRRNGGKQVDDEMFTTRRAPVNLFRQTSEFFDLLERIEREKYEVVVFDTLQRMARGANQDKASDAAIVVGAVDLVREASGGTVGFVAHSGKSDEDLRGSSAYEDDADIVVRTKRDEDEEGVRVTQTKRKDGPDGTTMILYPERVAGTGSLILSPHQAKLPDNPDALRKWAIPFMKELARISVGETGLNRNDLLTRTGCSGRGTADNTLDDLISTGFVLKLGTVSRPRYVITNLGRTVLEDVGVETR